MPGKQKGYWRENAARMTAKNGFSPRGRSTIYYKTIFIGNKSLNEKNDCDPTMPSDFYNTVIRTSGFLSLRISDFISGRVSTGTLTRKALSFAAP
jgi:hypothetical protein